MTPELITSIIKPLRGWIHYAIISTFNSLIPKAHDPTWHINSSPSHPSNSLDIEMALKEFLDNKTPDISPLTLWEAHKPVLRGFCLRQALHHKK